MSPMRLCTSWSTAGDGSPPRGPPQVLLASSAVIGQDSGRFLRERHQPPACLARLRRVHADLQVLEVHVCVFDQAQLFAADAAAREEGQDRLVACAEEGARVELGEGCSLQLGVDQVEVGEIGVWRLDVFPAVGLCPAPLPQPACPCVVHCFAADRQQPYSFGGPSRASADCNTAVRRPPGSTRTRLEAVLHPVPGAVVLETPGWLPPIGLPGCSASGARWSTVRLKVPRSALQCSSRPGPPTWIVCDGTEGPVGNGFGVRYERAG
jgi:hypothetical protein